MRRAPPALLADTPWLLREDGSGTREATDELFGRLGIDPPRMILGSNGAVIEAVVAGFGVALISLDAVADRVAARTIRRAECPHTPINRPWHLVASADVALSPTAALAVRSLLGSGDGFAPTAKGRRLLARRDRRSRLGLLRRW
ncbi:MAG: LysR substrate-binding domain-containing protein [Ilumatobacteraceae bacterium]